MHDEIFFFKFPAVTIPHLQEGFVTFAHRWLHALEAWPGRKPQYGNPARTAVGLSSVEMVTESAQHRCNHIDRFTYILKYNCC